MEGGPPTHTGPAIFGDNYVLPATWRGKIEPYVERMSACALDQLLTIDAWDQS